jgi:hypothetical protein
MKAILFRGGHACSNDKRLCSSPWQSRLYSQAEQSQGLPYRVRSKQPQSPQATQKSRDELALAEPEVVQLLLLMETTKNGKISKQECMKFMETEVDRVA